jgi:hypothetical protein
MSSEIAAEKVVIPEPGLTHSPVHKDSIEEQQVERIPSVDPNFVYEDNDEEPELHARTYFALAAMFLLNLVQVLALQGPPAVVRIIAGRIRKLTELTIATCSFHTSERISMVRPPRHGCLTLFHLFRL